MQIRKIIKNSSIEAWNLVSVYTAFYKHHKSVYANTNFKKLKLTNEEKKQYYEYWKVLSPLISLKTVEISKSLSEIFNKYIIPEEVYSLHVEPYLNSDKSVKFFENKSIYSKWYDSDIFPVDFFHKFDNIYYDKGFKVIDDIESFIENKIQEEDLPVVVKPNKGTIGGSGVNFIDSKESIKDVIKKHPDLVVEEKLQQSNLISEVNRDGVSTVRVTLYKDNEGVIHILETNLRMGKDGSLDNEGSGGIACNINSDGVLNRYATDRYANKYVKHPNSGYVFEGKTLPLYDQLIESSKYIFRETIGARIAGLDMLLDSNDKWRCIELSLFGLTTKPSQYAGDPFLGKHTDNIIKDLLSVNK